MNRLRYRPIVVVNLVMLRATVFLAEWALAHRDWVMRGRAYAPVVLGGIAAYLVGLVIGQAIVNGFA